MMSEHPHQNRYFREECFLRDRVQHHLIAALAHKQPQNLVFKGGTMMRVCWPPFLRFSEDLDFDWLQSHSRHKDGFHQTMERIAGQASKSCGLSIRYRARTRDRNSFLFTPGNSSTTGPLSVKVDGNVSNPIGYNKIIKRWEILRKHDIVSNQRIVGYSLETVMADKLRCLASPTRAKSRDWFDLHMLLASPEVDTLSGLRAFCLDPEVGMDTTTPEKIVTGLLEMYVYQEPDLKESWESSIRYGLHLNDNSHISFDRIAEGVLAALENLLSTEPSVVP